jgi:hypothetical protein
MHFCRFFADLRCHRGGRALKCWGWNADGQIGNDSATGPRFPLDVFGCISGVRAVSKWRQSPRAAVTTQGARHVLG